jgi:protein ImuB
LERLIAQVAAVLIHHGRGALRLECRLDCPPEAPARVVVGLFEPTAAGRHLFQLAQFQLERLRLAALVAAIEVEAPLTAPLEYRQQKLFAERAAREPRQWAALVDRLGSRLGYGAIVGVRLRSDAQPELAWQSEPLVGRTGRRGRGGAIPSRPPPRPLRLLSHPQRLDVPSISGNPPARFHFHGQEHRVARNWGPERIETGWWRGQAIGRDYFRVETVTGRRFWLFRRLRDRQWFLHGVFE